MTDGSRPSSAEITPVQLRQQLKQLLGQDVMGLSWEQKLAYARDYLGELGKRATPHAASLVAGPELAIVPFQAGRRPLDEALQPGAGCSEHVGLVGATAGGDGLDSDRVVLLYGARNLDYLYMRAQVDGAEPDLDVVVSGWLLSHDGAPSSSRAS